MERSDVITTLEVLKANCPKYLRDYHALDYAISSLKTDEAYQLMYEGEEIYTKDDVVEMLAELLLEMETLNVNKLGENDSDKCSNIYIGVICCKRILASKINKLKENKDEKK